jgi:hypothetical protein
MMRRWPALMLAALLAACGSDVDETQKMRTYLLIAQKVAGREPAPPAGTAGLTREILASLNRPADLVAIERIAVSAVVLLVATNGGVETWSSIDNRTVATRQGMITATRGLGGDLIAAETPPLARVAAGSGTFVRTMVILDGEDRPVRHRYLCEFSTLGTEELVIVQRRYVTRRVQESCAGDSGRFVNDHWFQGGTLRQSRQWAGPWLGYVDYARLRD